MKLTRRLFLGRTGLTAAGFLIAAKPQDLAIELKEAAGTFDIVLGKA